MAKEEVADPFLPKESQPSHFNGHEPMDDCEQHPYVIIPIPPSRQHLRICICCLCCCNRQLIRITIIFLVVACLILWLLWPSHPELQVVHVQLDHANIYVNNDNIVFLNTSMEIKVKIQNQDFTSHNYNLISILVGYRGKWLGYTTTRATFVNARSISYLDSTINLNGTQVHGSSLKQEDDLTMKFVPLEIVIEVGARFHFFSINIPIQAMASCTVNVDVDNQTIASQDCYPEESGYHATMDFPVLA